MYSLLYICGAIREPVGLRKMGSVASKAERRSLGSPWERNAAAVATHILAIGVDEARILALLRRDLNHLVKPQLFALVKVRRARKTKHEECGGTCAAQAPRTVKLRLHAAAMQPCTTLTLRGPAILVTAYDRKSITRGVADDIVIGEHPRVEESDFFARSRLWATMS